MFNFIKNTFTKIYTQFTQKASQLFQRKQIDEQALKELEQLLLCADTGVKTTKVILAELKKSFHEGKLNDGTKLKEQLEKQLKKLLINQKTPDLSAIDVFVLVGVNGSGKTTFAGKLAYDLHKQNKKVLLVAADTFRAAAPEQLNIWAERTEADIIIGKPNQDPASVVYTGCEQFEQKNYDTIIIDTAGRLQTKINLMNELEKITRVIKRKLSKSSILKLLTIDSMLGQNSLEQARIFNEVTNLDGIVLTKMDGTGKGGIVFAIGYELNLPVLYISYGEQPNQFKIFNANEYIQQLLEG